MIILFEHRTTSEMK